MKQLLRHTTSLLRTALLLAALAIAYMPVQAQTAAQWAEMPDAFETMNPAAIIGDGNYYYIQFYNTGHTICSYLTDCGAVKLARTRDFLPYANNRLWTLVTAGDGNPTHFKLKSKEGRYLYYASGLENYASNRYRFGCVEGFENAAILTFNQNGDGYDISVVGSESEAMYRIGANEWIDLAAQDHKSHTYDVCRLRFAKLKSNAAFIIYYRGEHADGKDNTGDNNTVTGPSSEETRHYLTYSGTASSSLGDNWWQSDVSSRQSIIPKDKPLCTLPTLAAYHKDGLWSIEKADVEGQFYIKKYGTSQYLNEDYKWGDAYGSELGAKDAIKGIYTLETPSANRYSRVQNVKYDAEVELTKDMFFNWNGYGADATVASDASNSVAFKVNDGTQLGGGVTVVGTDEVNYLKYANLSDYDRMTITGTAGIPLRVLMSRQESNNGPYVEKNVTIGSDGKAVVDLTNLELNGAKGVATVKMTYICGSADAVDTSYGDKTTETVTGGYNNGYNWDKGPGYSISDVGLGNQSWGINNIIYLQVDTHAIIGTIKKVTLKAYASGNNIRATEWGAGFTNMDWSSTMTWNSVQAADGFKITDLTPVDRRPIVAANDTQQISLDITGAFTNANAPDKIATIVVYETRPGGGTFRDPTVEVEYSPNVPVSYAHLNAIKTSYGGTTGTISSITLSKRSNSNVRYLHRAQGDGWQVLQWKEDEDETNNYWYAGFYPVEVPDPNQDDYYRVLAGFNNGYGVDGQMLTETGWLANYDDTEENRQLLILSQEDDYSSFYLKTPDGSYIKPTGGTTNNKSEGERLSNTGLIAKFNLKWYYVDPNYVEPAAKEIPVDHWVRHKISYLKTHVDDEDLDQRDLAEQGLATKEDSQWKNNSTDALDGFTQKVNHFEITHYVMKNDTREVLFPTVLRTNNDHVFFQRFYNYDKADTKMTNLDLDSLKSQVSLDDKVQYFLYKNGMVTGEKLDWTNIERGDLVRTEQNRFKFTNCYGKNFTVAVDVSRYSDLEYKNTSSPLDDDLIEPSLTMRYIYYMKDAKVIATNLTACTETSGNWLESKDIHFPAKRISYELDKLEGYQGEFLSLRHLFRDYWVFDNPNFVKEIQDPKYPDDPTKKIAVINEEYINANYNNPTDLDAFLDGHLVTAVKGNNSGRIVIEFENNNVGITLGGHIENNVAQGYYLYDEAYNNSQNYGDSRFMVFNYPVNGVVDKPENATATADLCAYFVDDNGRRYQLCKYTIIFDTEVDSETKKWRSVNSTDRDPKNLRNKAGKPIAKITFDYPTKSGFYQTPSNGKTKHNNNANLGPSETIKDSSPIPLPFAKTNYAFDGENCSWGSYALESKSFSRYGYYNLVVPSNVVETEGLSEASELLGYGIEADEGMRDGFLYIDASEQPGDICSISFQGDFCAGDKLMCSGWISGANMANPGTTEKRCPGGITLTMKGENEDGSTKTIYRFCPGQCYELTNEDVVVTVKDDNNQEHDYNTVEWQQFYFEFSTDKKYKRYWMEVNNNCVSSNGGDFMLDNIEIFANVPDVIPGVNTPLCISTDDNGNVVTDMRLLKLSVDFNKLKSSSNVSYDPSDDSSELPELGFVFLEKDLFLKTFRTGLQALTTDQKHTLHLDRFDFYNISLDDMANAIKEGEFSEIKEVAEEYDTDGAHAIAFEAYHTAFDAAILGEKTTWHSKKPKVNMKSSVLYYEWNPAFTDDVKMPVYSFADAVNRTSPVYREMVKDEKYVVFNGNFPALNWKTNTDYYIVTSNDTYDEATTDPVTGVTTLGRPFTVFNLCSECTRSSVFQIEPPYELLGLEKSSDTNDYVVCEGQIPTLLTDLKGYDLNGNEVPMQDLNYDWWLGDPANGLYATLTKYHEQEKDGIRLDEALSTLRIYYPDVTDLDGIIGGIQKGSNPELTINMVNYLKELVKAGQLVLHQKSISVPAKKTDEVDDPYFYLVACPIHDEKYDQALNPHTVSVVKNGSMEGFDVSSFFMGDPSTSNKSPATITTGAGKDGSRGISITSSDNPATESADDYDTQFFIRANEVLPVGTIFHLEFDYKASKAATVATQAHSEPGAYNHYACIGDVEFTTEWQHFNADITVSDYMGNGVDNNKDNSFQTIAFNLWNGTDDTGNGITYFFDNVDFYVYSDNKYVAYFCDEPQGLRVKVGDKAPTLKTGFVPLENGFNEYHYPTDSDPVLSIRLAKKAQFMTVQHGTTVEAPVQPTEANGPTAPEADQLHYLWLPIRDGLTQTASAVIKKAEDYNIYLASTNDPTWDNNIYKAMKKGSLPIVGKIVNLYAINTKNGNTSAQNDNNRLCVYFTENFDVREGYNYTLSLPFQEEPDNEGNGVNACDGTILINLKIVPDYEVWTGATGYTDWNNDENWRRADGNYHDNSGVNQDELYVENAATTSPLHGYMINADTKVGNTVIEGNYRSPKDRILRKGFAPLYCTHVLMKSDEWGKAPVLYDGLDGASNLSASPFPNLRDKDGWDGTTQSAEPTKATATPILRYDMQARLYDIWPETYGEGVYPNKGRVGDLISEMYQINSCDEIAFQPGTELRNAYLLNYNNAWMEYQLDNNRWYLLGSALQGTIAGEWYAQTGTAKQKTTYYDDVTFGSGYDRYSPAIYQRSWDKAKAVLYEVGADYLTTDNPDDLQLENNESMPGDTQQGTWSETNWDYNGADRYLDRLGYKPMDGKKVNVAIQGIWSNTYNDATVDYSKGGFSVMVNNGLKNNDTSGGTSIVRLPKEDTMYDYYGFGRDGNDNPNSYEDIGTNTQLSEVQTVLNRAKNRGRLKTDKLLPESTQKLEKEASSYKYGDRHTYTRIPIKETDLTAMNNTFIEQSGNPPTAGFFSESIAGGISDLGFYLVENPFPCGLDMNKFFETNNGLHKKYWLLTATGQHLVQKADVNNEWIPESGNSLAANQAVVAPGQGFFVQSTDDEPTKSIEVTFNKDMQAQSRYGMESGNPKKFTIVVGQKQLMEVLKDEYDNPVYIEVDYNKNGIYGETLADGEEREVVMVPVYLKDSQTGELILDEEGNKIPVLDDEHPITQDVTIYNYVQSTNTNERFPLRARTRGGETKILSGLVITAQRGNDQSSALVMQREGASNDFLPEEDTETFICSEELKQVPTVYTLCGRLATTINSIHDFSCLPVGVESASKAPCTLTFQGVELLGDSVAFYDAVEQKLTPLESGMQFSVSGQTQNRYYLVRSLSLEKAAEETHLQIFAKDRVATVIASTQEPLTSVRCYDTAGRLVYSASPQEAEHSFELPSTGVYIIEAQTDNDHKTKKVMVK